MVISAMKQSLAAKLWEGVGYFYIEVLTPSLWSYFGQGLGSAPIPMTENLVLYCVSIIITYCDLKSIG